MNAAKMELAMVRRTKNPDLKSEGMLTEAELEIMRALWQHESSMSIRDVCAALPESRNLAYTTVATFLKILEQKGAVSADKAERAIVYSPLLSKLKYEERGVRHLAESVFDGDAIAIVARLVDSEKISAEKLKRIRSLIDSKLRGDE